MFNRRLYPGPAPPFQPVMVAKASRRMPAGVTPARRCARPACRRSIASARERRARRCRQLELVLAVEARDSDCRPGRCRGCRCHRPRITSTSRSNCARALRRVVRAVGQRLVMIELGGRRPDDARAGAAQADAEIDVVERGRQVDVEAVDRLEQRRAARACRRRSRRNSPAPARRARNSRPGRARTVRNA